MPHCSDRQVKKHFGAAWGTVHTVTFPEGCCVTVDGFEVKKPHLVAFGKRHHLVFSAEVELKPREAILF